jgi:hypothetical protein
VHLGTVNEHGIGVSGYARGAHFGDPEGCAPSVVGSPPSAGMRPRGYPVSLRLACLGLRARIPRSFRVGVMLWNLSPAVTLDCGQYAAGREPKP